MESTNAFCSFVFATVFASTDLTDLLWLLLVMLYRLPHDQGVTDVACGDHHVVAVADGGVYAWGDNTWGQCGRPAAPSGGMAPPAAVSAPILPFGGRRASSAARYSAGGCGSPNAAVSVQLGLDLDRSQPVRVACGGRHTLLLLPGGQVLGCGAAAEGQLPCIHRDR